MPCLYQMLKADPTPPAAVLAPGLQCFPEQPGSLFHTPFSFACEPSLWGGARLRGNQPYMYRENKDISSNYQNQNGPNAYQIKPQSACCTVHSLQSPRLCTPVSSKGRSEAVIIRHSGGSTRFTDMTTVIPAATERPTTAKPQVHSLDSEQVASVPFTALSTVPVQ